jgi:hypothetical protein
MDRQLAAILKLSPPTIERIPQQRIFRISLNLPALLDKPIVMDIRDEIALADAMDQFKRIASKVLADKLLEYL